MFIPDKSQIPWKFEKPIFFFIIEASELSQVASCPKVFYFEKTNSIQYDSENVELMHDCSPKQLHMGTARFK